MTHYFARGYYADDVKPPKRPGRLALAVELGTKWALDMEVSVFEARPDIGRVESGELPRHHSCVLPGGIDS